MKLIYVFLFLLISVGLFSVTEESEYWKRINDYDYIGFLKDYNSLDEANSLQRGKLAYALYITGDRDSEWIEIAANSISAHLQDPNLSQSERGDYAYILAESSKGLIVDASSYMKYSPIYESAITQCLKIDPDNPYYRLSSAQGLMWFPTSRGTKEEGEALLFQLEKENPNNTNIIMAYAYFKLNSGNIDIAEAGFKTVLSINAKNKEAKEQLDEINLSKKELTIREITIINSIKTSKSRVLKKLEDFKDKKFHTNTKGEINRRISEISSIGGANIKGIQIDENYIDLELDVIEDNTRAVMFLAGGGFGLDYSGDVLPGGMGALGYMDSNFLGTGYNLLFLTAGIFNKLDLTCPGLIDDGIIDLKLSLESMAYAPASTDVIHDGAEVYSVKDTYHSVQVGLGRSFDIGLSAFINYNSNWTFKEDIEGHTSPNMIHTNTISGDFSFDTVGMILSSFQNPNGFRISFNPTWVYKDNYKPWGKDGSLFTHNDKPAFTFRTHLGYYTDTAKNQNLSADFKYLASINPYQSNKFALGQPQSSMDSDSLAGYLPGEIVFENGLLGNIKYTFNVIPNKFNLFGKYDVLFDIDNRNLYNGASVGTAVKLPFDIELAGELGVGFNANRSEGPGIQASVSLTKLSVL